MDTGQILLDTSSLIMLIRIIPTMLVDDKYRCCTISQVQKEFLATPRFKVRYPWRNQFREKVAFLPAEVSDNPEVVRYLEAISCLLATGVINKRDGKLFDLSAVDQQLLACSLGNGYVISTCDQPLEDFAEQEFRKEFKGSISPLGILNSWIKSGLIILSDSMYAVVLDWRVCQEPPQPGRQKRNFELLTKRPYPGS
jgi:hypothetical protein